LSTDVVEGASGRGAAGGDVRFRDIPSEGIEACVAKLEAALEKRTIAMPLLRMLRRALLQERFVLPVVSSTLSHSVSVGTETPNGAAISVLLRIWPLRVARSVKNRRNVVRSFTFLSDRTSFSM